MSILRILAPSAEGLRLNWVRRDDSGQCLSEGGEAQLQAVESDGDVELIVAAERVLFIPAEISHEQLSRLSDENLPWLAEPYLTQDIERLHIVRGPHASASSTLTLCAVEHAWLGGIVQRLAEKQIKPTRILPEAMLSQWKKGQWIVLLKPGGGFVRTGECGGFILDQGKGGKPPTVLKLALQSGDKPDEIRVYCDDVASPDTQEWTQQLGVSVHFSGPWQWQSASPTSAIIDLARGPYTPPGKARDLLRRLRPSLYLLAGILALTLIGHLITSGLSFLEKARLNAAIEAELRTAFPRTQAILDPVRQMRQNVEQLRQKTGELTPGDFLPLLAKVSAVLGKDLSGRMEKMTYEPHALVLELSLPDASRLERLKRDGAGLVSKWENLPSDNGSGVRVRLSITL